MVLVLSAATGVILGILHASGAIRPLLASPLLFEPRYVVLGFFTRLVLLSAVLLAAVRLGADSGILLPAVVLGFTAQATILIRRIMGSVP